MARKAKAEKQKEVSPFAELAKEYKEDIEYIAQWGDKECVFHIKKHISPAIRSAILSNINRLYFGDDGYDPAFGDLALRMVIAQQYTGETFNDDVEVYELADREMAIWNHLPMEAKEFYGFAYDKIEYEEKRKVREAEALKAVYDRITEVGEAFTSLAGTISSFLDTAQKSIDESDVSMNDLVELFKAANKKDEKKIAQAVLDYRAEKAKREAEKGDEM